MSNRLQVNPRLAIRIDGLERSYINLAVGEGTNRQNLICNDPTVVDCLLKFSTPQTKADALELTERLFGVDSNTAEQVLNGLIEAQLLISEQSCLPDIEQMKIWENYGWRDAFDFHSTTRDLGFNPDYEDYQEAMNGYFDAVRQGLDKQSPGPYKEYTDKPFIELIRTRARIDGISFKKTIARRQPLAPYSRESITIEQFSELMEQVYAMRSETRGLLGTHMKRTSPSGGARHPIEAYVAINSIEQIPCGLYHYSTKRHCLELLREGDFRDEVASICFEKTAIKTAAATIFLTARWARHMWKYRYARSYRMVLFDTGHLIQTHVLTGCAIGLESFLCPSVHDSRGLSFLGLEQDCDEGVLFAIGIGAM